MHATVLRLYAPSPPSLPSSLPACLPATQAGLYDFSPRQGSQSDIQFCYDTGNKLCTWFLTINGHPVEFTGPKVKLRTMTLNVLFLCVVSHSNTAGITKVDFI
jgi:hypothetical protein